MVNMIIYDYYLKRCKLKVLALHTSEQNINESLCIDFNTAGLPFVFCHFKIKSIKNFKQKEI